MVSDSHRAGKPCEVLSLEDASASYRLQALYSVGDCETLWCPTCPRQGAVDMGPVCADSTAHSPRGVKEDVAYRQWIYSLDRPGPEMARRWRFVAFLKPGPLISQWQSITFVKPEPKQKRESSTEAAVLEWGWCANLHCMNWTRARIPTARAFPLRILVQSARLRRQPNLKCFSTETNAMQGALLHASSSVQIQSQVPTFGQQPARCDAAFQVSGANHALLEGSSAAARVNE
eukprot:s7719_g2.t1